MPKKVQRANSNVFAMFEKKQIEEFKEVSIYFWLLHLKNNFK